MWNTSGAPLHGSRHHGQVLTFAACAIVTQDRAVTVCAMAMATSKSAGIPGERLRSQQTSQLCAETPPTSADQVIRLDLQNARVRRLIAEG